jgi:ATPase AAA-2 domain protein
MIWHKNCLEILGIILEILSGNSMDEIDFPDKEFSEDIEDKEKEEKGKNQNNTKEDKRTVEAKKFLDNFGTNLNEKAKHGQIDKVIGREKEIERLVEILNRRKKNNPCIIGEPGVGKTALAQGLALRIVEGDVPAKLMDKEIYLLDMGALVAGTQFRGQFEGRLERLVKECKFLGNIVLVIDEIHTITKLRRRRKLYKCSKYIKASFSKPGICRL